MSYESSELQFIPLRPPAFDLKKSKSRFAEVPPDATLEYRCRVVVAMHLERYPPEAIGILGEDAWASVIKMKHDRTAPDKGKRRTPAITERYLSAVEQENPHLAESQVADKLVWKDIVESKFPVNGLARPKGLLYPWPILVQRVLKAANDMLDIFETEEVGDKDFQNLERAIHVLYDTPMCISLLQETEVGKMAKKFIKLSKTKSKAAKMNLFTPRPISSCTKASRKSTSPLDQVEEMLHSWKDLAAKSGVEIQGSSRKEQTCAYEADLARDLRAAESCQTWRQLYLLLQDRETNRRVSQGARMRESRERIAQNQPKIVKVRPAKAKHEAILNRPMGTKFSCSTSIASCNPTKSKLHQLKEESKVAAAWQKSSPGAKVSANSFGNAVAFASTTKKSKKLKLISSTTVSIAGGKRMVVPTKIPASALKKKLSTARQMRK